MDAADVDAENGVRQETVAQSGRVGEEGGDEQGEQGGGIEKPRSQKPIYTSCG
jgi:hypothetical protein